jgi:hypothetical protein
MTEPNNTPIIKPEIVTPPSVSNLSVAQVGTGMFSVTMQVMMVVRFPADVPAGTEVLISSEQRALQAPAVLSSVTVPVAQTPAIASTTAQAASGELMYGNGDLPNAFEGEAEAFQAFIGVHGYVPQTRDVLVQWATSSQGGA